MADASTLDGLGLTFHETMAGAIGTDHPLQFDVDIRIPDLGDFLRQPEHQAGMTGSVTCADLGGTTPIRDGRFQLFVADAAHGIRQLRYFFRFPVPARGTFCLAGHKDVHDDPGLDVVHDLTCLFTDIHAGPDEKAPVYASGELHFLLTDLPTLVGSLKVEGAHELSEEVAARLAFGSFVWGALRDEYLDKARLVYDTSYENLALAGALQSGPETLPFFLASGVHGKGFPWGDG